MRAAARRTRRGGRAPQARGAIHGARAGALPAGIRPELATLVREPPEGSAWLHEVKFDGYRIIARVHQGGVRLLSRNGKDWTGRFAAVASALKQIPSDPPRGRGVHWVEPRLAAEASFTEWTDEGLLRHPSFQGLREDKKPAEIHREGPAGTAPGGSGDRSGRAPAPRRPRPKRRT